MVTTAAAQTQMRPLEAVNARSVKWCATSFQINNEIKAIDARIGSVALCDLAERLGDVEFILAFAELLPRRESTPQNELIGVPAVLRNMLRDGFKPVPHTEAFLAQIERIKNLVKELYALRRIDSVQLLRMHRN